jgi:predicted enzyme related to lactoylglutathione lyase
MPNRVIHFEIQADDIDRAKKFYEQTFRWKIDEYKGDSGGMKYWTIDTGPKDEPGISGGLYPRPADHKINTYDCTILVEDIDKAIEDVKKNGGTIRSGKMEMKGLGYFARATDPEGNWFGLMQATEWKPA